jgi:putative ABC transport system substrate-binding protein
MRRRDVILLFGGAAATWPLAAPAQQRTYRIGLLEAIPASRNDTNLSALRRGLQDLGFIEGQNLVIEYRSADGRPERFPDLVAELVHLKVDLIVARGTPATMAAKNAPGTIPVVMATMGGPGSIVASFAGPGGHVTGVITFSTELTGKRIELLKELVPSLSRIALLHNMSNPAVPPEWEETKAAARHLGLSAELLDVRSQGDLDHAFDAAVQQRVDGLVVGADSLTQMHLRRVVDFADRHKVPTVYPAREFIEAGGLISYAVNYPDLYLRLASFVGKILKGAKPGELPVEQPTQFELVVNLKTASALGLTIPPLILARADEVME